MSLTVAQLVARLSADTSGFYKGMAVANASMVRSGSIISKVAAGAGLATVAMGFMALKAAGNFQQSMNILQAVSGATDTQLGSLSKRAIQLGADLHLPNTSAKDAADAMVELSKGGLSVKQILDATKGTIELAIAGNIGMADAATINARALKTFNLDGSQATVVANLLAAAANKSTAEISDLADGFQNAGGQFQGAGQTIQTLTVALAELADKGLNGSYAGTALKTMFQRLENPTKKAGELMTSWGISIADSSGHIKPLPNIIGQFQNALKDLSPIQQQQALNTIFGARANQAMAKLVDDGTAGWDRYSKSIVGVDAAQQMADARTKGFNGSIQGFMSAIETLAIQLGTPLLGPLTSAVQAVSRFIESINPNTIIAFFGAISDGVQSIFHFVDGSNAAQAAIGALLAGFIAFKVVTGIIEAAQKAFAILNLVMDANPFVLVAAAIIALGAALFILYERSATVREALNQIASYLRENLGPAFDYVKTKVLEAVNYLQQEWTRIAAWFHQNQAQIKADALQAWGDIKTNVANALAALEAIFKIIWPAMRDSAKIAWEAIKNVVTTTINLIRDVVNIAMGLLKGDWGRAWNGLKSLVVDALDGAIGLAWIILRGAATVALDLATSIGEAIWNGIKGGLGDIASKLKGALVDPIVSAYHSVLGALGIHSPSRLFSEGVGKPIAEGIIQGYLLGIPELLPKMTESMHQALDAARTAVQNSQSVLGTAFQRMSDYAFQAFDGQTTENITKMQASFARKLNDLVTAPLASALAAAKATYDRESASIQNPGKTSAQKALDAMQEAHNNQQLKQGLSDAKDAVKQTMRDISEAQKTLAADTSSGASSDQIAQDASALKNLQDQLISNQRSVADAQYAIKVDAAQKTADLANAAQDREEKKQQAHLDLLYQKQQEGINKAYASLTTALDKQEATQELNYTALRNLQKQHLQDMLTNLQKALAKDPGIWQKDHDKIMAKFKTAFGPDYKTAGTNLGLAFAQGIRESFDSVQGAVTDLANLVARYLKTNSPTEAGPMASLDTWWSGLGTALVSGMDLSTVRSGAAALAGTFQDNIGVGGSSDLARASVPQAFSRDPVALTITGNTFLTESRDTLRSIANQLAPFLSSSGDGRLQLA